MADRDAHQHWNARYRSRGAITAAPSPFLVACGDALPDGGHALDVGGGSGRNALWLASRGFDVTVVDVAEEGLALADEAARAAGLEIRTLQRDLEADGLPPGRFDLLVCMHFLHRPLFATWAEALEPGGLLVFEQPTATNLERHPKPSRRFCLEEGELPGLVQGLHVLVYEERWNETGRHEARLLARKAVPFLRDEPEHPEALRREVEALRAKTDVASLGRRGELLRILGALTDANRLLERAVVRSRAEGNPVQLAANEIRLATARFYDGAHDAAEVMLRAVAAERRGRDDQRLLDFALQHLGKCVAEQGRFEEAAALFREALALRQAAGDDGLIGSSQDALALADERALEGDGSAAGGSFG